MICAHARRETEEASGDESLVAFQNSRLNLIEREARAAGFASRRVLDVDAEYLEVFWAGRTGPARATEPQNGSEAELEAELEAEAAAFEMLARRLRGCLLGALSFEVDGEEETAALEKVGVYSPWSNGVPPLAVAVEVRGEGFARELSGSDRREIEELVAAARKGRVTEEGRQA